MNKENCALKLVDEIIPLNSYISLIGTRGISNKPRRRLAISLSYVPVLSMCPHAKNEIYGAKFSF